MSDRDGMDFLRSTPIIMRAEGGVASDGRLALCSCGSSRFHHYLLADDRGKFRHAHLQCVECGLCWCDGRCGHRMAPVRDWKCRECGCTATDCERCIEKTGHPCHWVARDLCSACAPPAAPSITVYRE